jgi:hypothetical protein
MTKVSYERNGTTFAVEVESLPPASIAYLLQYGFAQSLQDSIAGLAKAKRLELEETDSFKNGLLSAESISDECDLAVLTKLQDRTDAIMAGTVGARVGTPRDEVTTLAREQVKAALAKKKLTVTKEKLAELVASHVERNRPAIEAELKRRRESTVEVDIAI